MSWFPIRVSRLAFPLAAAFIVTALPLGSATAQSLPSAGVAPAVPQLLDVDVPSSGTDIWNGDVVEVGGWTDGSRVDVYLDGPAGEGQIIGSTYVDVPRPDVVATTHNPALADSGFDVVWQPITLNAGPHTFYVYSLINGTWDVATVPFIAA